MSITAMKQALEALEYPLNQSHENFNVDMAELISHRAITALRQAIEQAEQAKPVAWMYDFLNPDSRDEVIRDWATQDLSEIDGAKGFNVRPLYTAPPPRQPLTDEEIGAILDDPNIAEKHQGNWLILPYAYARAIEAAHGIKGEA